MPDANGYSRILSLDGGGSWVVLELMALRSIYGPNTAGVAILAKFDLVVANSGGSIVLAMLASNRTVQQVIDMMADPVVNVRSSIFQTLSFLDEIGHLVGIGPQYSTAAKLPALTAAINGGPFPPPANRQVANVPLANIPASLGIATQFVISAFDYDMERSRLFRSNPGSPAANFSPPDAITSLVEAVHASSTPPVMYFDAPAVIPAGRFWDGGIAGYNNPIEVGVVELVAAGVDRRMIRILSLGSGMVALPPQASGPTADPSLVQGSRDTGIIAAVMELAGSIVDDPPDVASYHAALFLDPTVPPDAAHPVPDGPVTRLNPLVRPVRNGAAWSAPQLNIPADLPQDLADFKTLVKLGLDAVAQPDVDVIVKLGEAWIRGDVRNQPLRWRPSDDPGAEMGTSDFATGAALATARFM